MAQWQVYRNANSAAWGYIPYLLDVQTDLLHTLSTTVVVPLRPASGLAGELMGSLTPVLHIEGALHAMITPQLAGISRKQLGQPVADLSAQRDVIVAALDLLITGI